MSLIDSILDSIFDDEWVGKRGEKLTERELKWVRLFGRKGKILRNVYIPKDNGETSEIDVVYVTQKGIFVIESKNFSGWIFGDDKYAYWTASLPNGKKNRFYSPVKQNETHMRWLGKYLESLNYKSVPLFSLIVFSERCELKKMTIEREDVRVIKRDRLYANIRDMWDNLEDSVSIEDVESMTSELKKLTNQPKSVKQAHIDDINKKYSKTKEKSEKTKSETKSADVKKDVIKDKVTEEKKTEERKFTCPKCGGELVLRVAKRGDNAGKKFYGCKNYPKCRYIYNIEE